MWRAFVVAFLLSVPACARAHAVERPPQFVLLAFDTCTELERWKELSEFVADMNKSGDRLHFTFFVSGVNFIADAKRDVYEGPGRRPGASNIDFGGSVDDVRRRVEYVNDLYRNGHEIASHAVGHFSGRGWSAADWAKEFRSYRDVLANVATNNGLGSGVKLAFSPAQVIGFRAPYLDTSPGLYTVLKQDGFRYDTSGESQPNAWPEKIGGTWRFNLVELKLHGAGKTTLSMDYNFFVTQSHGVVDRQRREYFGEQVLQTYLDYFKSNYTGNRAPLNIGHHFFDYEDGAYKQALKSFARMVCGLPEVRCVTYAKLADFMDQQSPAALEAYRKGDFPRAAEPAPSIAGLERSRPAN
jgi:peptidoglycan/xylan/chitin deacetylase (PgdA/CDA1 family)